MSTAHRPTWNSARGRGDGQGGFRSVAPSAKWSSRDAPAQMEMKYRVDLKREVKEELREREEAALRARGRLKPPPPDTSFAKQNDPDTEPSTTGASGAGNPDGDDVQLDYELVEDADADVAESDGEDSDSEDDDDDEDDEEELRRELEKIKREREEEKLRKEQEEQAFQEKMSVQAAAGNNPLLNLTSGPASAATNFKVKRRWDDDVVFRNQARKTDESGTPRFINDTIRNDFHKRFLSKYIR